MKCTTRLAFTTAALQKNLKNVIHFFLNWKFDTFLLNYKNCMNSEHLSPEPNEKRSQGVKKNSLLDSYLLQRAKQSLFSLKLVQSTEFSFTKSRLYCMKEINVILVYQFHEID